MARICGTVGYDLGEQEIRPGVWGHQISTRTYYGDVIKDNSRRTTADKINDDILFENRFSIVADGYAYEHYSSILYVEWMGTKWKVTGVEYQRPRLILSVGGVYNGTTS